MRIRHSRSEDLPRMQELYAGARAFMAANGTGKSTFFLCCTAILKPQKGQLFF